MLRKLAGRIFQYPAEEIVIVSGLPRSGTSMMMKMLEAAGIPPLTDHERTPDVDNPKGYYEFERVKKLKDGDTDWLPQARGKAVKVISALLPHLPGDYEYRVIFMRREMAEILASQRKMQVHRSTDIDTVTDEELARLYEKHLAITYSWLDAQPNIRWVDLSYNALLREPITQLNALRPLLGDRLPVRRMAEIVDPTLHRQKA